MALGPLLVGALALYLGQDTNWDFRNYHWYNGYAFVTGRFGFDLLPSQTPFFYNPLIDVPFYFVATIFPAKGAGFILAILQGLNFPLLFMLAHSVLVIPNARHKVWLCAFLAALGVLGGGGIAQIGVTFYDNVTSLGLFVSILFVFRFWDRLFNGPWLAAFFIAFLAGIPTGLMMGLKLPAVIFCVGFCFSFLFVKGAFRRRFLISFACGLGILLGLAITLGPWAHYLWVTYQNPLFPYFNDFFGSPFAPAVSARDTQFVPSGFWDRALFPFIFSINPLRVGEIIWRDYRLPLLYALLPISLLLRLLFAHSKDSENIPFQPVFASFLLWFGVLSYSVWLFMFAIYRYLLPLEMMAPLLLVITIGMMPLPTKRRVKVTAAVFLIALLSICGGDWGRLPHWLDKAVEVDVPPIENAADTMIIMTSMEPFSHVITAFPKEIPFIRVQSNFTGPEKKTAFSALLEKRIREHQGKFMLLAPSWALDWTQETLDPFKLTFDPLACRPVHDKLYESKLVLCNAHRKDK